MPVFYNFPWYPTIYKHVITPVQQGDYKSIWDQTLIANTYINGSGAPVAYNGWSATDYIEIPDNTTNIYRVGNINRASYNAWYDSNKNFISFFAANNIDTIPANAKYVRYSAEIANMTGDIIVYIGD